MLIGSCERCSLTSLYMPSSVPKSAQYCTPISSNTAAESKKEKGTISRIRPPGYNTVQGQAGSAVTANSWGVDCGRVKLSCGAGCRMLTGCSSNPAADVAAGDCCRRKVTGSWQAARQAADDSIAVWCVRLHCREHLPGATWRTRCLRLRRRRCW